MVQVVTRENMQQLIETGKVDEYKPPEDVNKPKESASAEPDPKKDEVKVEADKPQDDLTEDERAAKAAMGAKKWDQVIGRRHRLQREADEARRHAEDFAEMSNRERLLAEKRVHELEEQLKKLEGKPPTVIDSAEPKPEQFKDAVEYARALAKYEAEKAVKADRQERQAAQDQAEEARLNAARQERNREFAKTHPDFEEVMGDLGDKDFQVPGFIQAFINKSPLSAALMYHFAKNPEVFEAIVAQEPVLAMAEIGELVASLKASPLTTRELIDMEKKHERSKAPAPIAPLNGNSVPIHKDPRQMNAQEIIELERVKQEAAVYRRQRH